MASEFRLDVDMESLKNILRATAEGVEEGVKSGLNDVKDAWVADAVDIAPLDKGALRAVIDGEVHGTTLTVTGNARQGDFNYGYYIHERDAGGKKLRHPGTKKQFLDEAYDAKKFEQILEDELKRRIEKAGW